MSECLTLNIRSHSVRMCKQFLQLVRAVHDIKTVNETNSLTAAVTLKRVSALLIMNSLMFKMYTVINSLIYISHWQCLSFRILRILFIFFYKKFSSHNLFLNDSINQLCLTFLLRSLLKVLYHLKKWTYKRYQIKFFLINIDQKF